MDVPNEDNTTCPNELKMKLFHSSNTAPKESQWIYNKN